MQDKICIAIFNWFSDHALYDAVRSIKESALMKSEHFGTLVICSNTKVKSVCDLVGDSQQIEWVLVRFVNESFHSLVHKIVSTTNCGYILPLNQDWTISPEVNDIEQTLFDAKHLIQNMAVNCVRLRHRTDGVDLSEFTAIMGKEKEEKNNSRLLDCIHYHKSPESFGYIHKIKAVHDYWYFAFASYADYTLSPCLYRTSFVLKYLLKDMIFTKTEDIKNNWTKISIMGYPVTVAQGEGLFKYSRTIHSQ